MDQNICVISSDYNYRPKFLLSPFKEKNQFIWKFTLSAAIFDPVGQIYGYNIKFKYN